MCLQDSWLRRARRSGPPDAELHPDIVQPASCPGKRDPADHGGRGGSAARNWTALRCDDSSRGDQRSRSGRSSGDYARRSAEPAAEFGAGISGLPELRILDDIPVAFIVFFSFFGCLKKRHFCISFYALFMARMQGLDRKSVV